MKIAVGGKPVSIRFLGYERIEEGIYSYYQADNIPAVKKLTVTDDLLFEYNDQQMSLIHGIVGGERKSTKLSNPDKVAELKW